jgi:hypothetical protein
LYVVLASTSRFIVDDARCLAWPIIKFLSQLAIELGRLPESFLSSIEKYAQRIAGDISAANYFTMNCYFSK